MAVITHGVVCTRDGNGVTCTPIPPRVRPVSDADRIALYRAARELCAEFTHQTPAGNTKNDLHFTTAQLILGHWIGDHGMDGARILGQMRAARTVAALGAVIEHWRSVHRHATDADHSHCPDPGRHSW